MADPSEDDIASFVAIAGTSRDHAISFLQAHGGNFHRAINAYFEDPTPPQSQNTGYQNESNLPGFQIEHSDPVPASNAPLSRPPSKTNLSEQVQGPEYQPTGSSQTQPGGGNSNSDKNVSLAEQEERELQQAVAMSLNQNLGQQETGVTTTSKTGAGLAPATRDHYDASEWAVTLFNSSSHEITISPDPADRKRTADEPPFLRPSPDGLRLAGLVTILHAIPLAREALLLRNRLLSNYGHDAQWWNGQPISLPKVVTIQDAQDSDTDWDDIIVESQRLMAFLDSTTRAFGSADVLAGLKAMTQRFDPEESTCRFLELWQQSAVRADPGNQLATVFSCKAFKRPISPYDTPLQSDFFELQCQVDPDDHGGTLYDVLDRTVWQDRCGEELDDVWLEHVAEVLSIKLESSQSNRIDINIPSVFYPDRYLDNCRDMARKLRLQRLQVYEDIAQIEKEVKHFTDGQEVKRNGLTNIQLLEKSADAALVFLLKSRDGKSNPEAAQERAQRVADGLRDTARKIDAKLKELESRKQSARETLRSHSKFLTEPSNDSSQPPHHKYMLRGVCTEPHVTYILRHSTPESNESMIDSDVTWQWWRISFSTEDAKTRQMESNQGSSAALQKSDVIGYTARKVSEEEVLRAAREESKTVLLVYATSNAVNFPEEPTPPELQVFVNADNKAFEAEFEDTPTAREWEWPQGTNSWTGGANTWDEWEEQKHETSTAVPSSRNINVFDYQVQDFGDETGPSQEMQERGDRPLLSRNNTSSAVPIPNAASDWDDGEQKPSSSV